MNYSPCRYLVDQHHVFVIPPFLQCVLLTSLVIKGYNCQGKFETFILLVTIIDDFFSSQSYSGALAYIPGMHFCYTDVLPYDEDVAALGSVNGPGRIRQITGKMTVCPQLSFLLVT